MLESFVTIIRYCFSLIYGIVIYGILTGIFRDEDGNINKTNCIISFMEFLLIGSLQLVIYLELGLEITMKTYPVHTHLVMVIVVMVFCKVKKIVAILSFLIGYMSLQMPNWFSKIIAGMVHDEHGIVECISYVILVCAAIFMIKRFLSDAAADIIRGPRKVQLAFMIVPAIYYLFDYVTTIWTDLLYEGNYYAVQFMPFMISFAHLIFSYFYSQEMQRQDRFKRENFILEAQAKTAETEIESMRQKNEATRIYRHDMRHHFALIQSMAATGDLEGIQDYIEESIAGLDAITPHRFCENERLNLVLSYFAAMADKKGIKRTFDVRQPDKIPLTDKELCSMVSNALENAIKALKDIRLEERTLKLVLSESDSKFIFMVENPYAYWIDFEDDLPTTTEEGHGFGTKSIKKIAEDNGGTVAFTASKGMFRVRVMIPMEGK